MAYGHIHTLVQIDDFMRTDGLRQMQRRCICGYQEQRRYEGKECVWIRIRYLGGWVDPVDWFTLQHMVQLCAHCAGDPSTIDDCAFCGGIGVLDVESGGKLVPLPPKKRRR